MADDGQHVAVCGAGAAAACTAGVDIPHCVDDTVRAHGLGESARAAVRFAGAKQRARAVLHAACSEFCVAAAVFSRWTVRNGVLVADSAAGACACHRKGVLPY